MKDESLGDDRHRTPVVTLTSRERRHNVGYVVDDKSFPAVQEVNPGVVQSLLKDLCADAQVSKVSVPASDPLRDGYKGMIIAVGTA